MRDGPARVELVQTDGIFELDGGRWEVTNNIWLVGDDHEVVVVDAAHDHNRVVEAVRAREVRAILLTHGHNDHINAAVALGRATGAPCYLHPADRMLWDAVYPGQPPDNQLEHGQSVGVGSSRLEVLHTPGHSPGSCCFFLTGPGPGLPVLFSGDTLFRGGPGATGRSYSDRPTILASITEKLLVLPAGTAVHTGHGEDTTIGAEAGAIAGPGPSAGPGFSAGGQAPGGRAGPGARKGAGR